MCKESWRLSLSISSHRTDYLAGTPQHVREYPRNHQQRSKDLIVSGQLSSIYLTDRTFTSIPFSGLHKRGASGEEEDLDFVVQTAHVTVRGSS